MTRYYAIPETRTDIEPLEVIRAYVEGQANLGYAQWNPGPAETDVILATFPKSGSTWTSYLLHQLCSRGDEEFEDIKDVVVDITPGHWDPARNPFLEEQRFSPRTYKTHGSYELAPRGARYIYVVRNPQDSFWSLYCFIHDLFGLDTRAPIDRFYRDYYIDRFSTGHDIGNPWTHILSWFPQRETGKLLWLCYEDLVEHRVTSLRRIARWIGVNPDNDLIDLVTRRSDIAYMRGMSDKINPSPHNYVGKLVAGFGEATQCYARNLLFGKLRKGRVGDGRANLPSEIRQDMEYQWQQRITPVLGFDSYRDMLEHCGLAASGDDIDLSLAPQPPADQVAR